jgi:hypothetical protein
VLRSRRSSQHIAGAGAASRIGRAGVVKIVCCAVIASAAAGTIGLTVHNDVATTAGVLSPWALNLGVHESKQEWCLYRLIRRDVPRGGAVYVASYRPAQMQRLAELSTLWATPRVTARTAEWAISWYAGGSCYGIGLKVRRI